MSTRRTALHAGLVVAVVGALAAALLVGARIGAPQVPVDDSADAGFLRDMQAHHAQAVEMSVLLRDATEDARTRQMALDIALGQQQQMGQMYALLASWDLSQQPAGQQMAWMEGHGSHAMSMGQDGLMPGMATAAELEQLRTATGVDAERLWLSLMIDHHRGGVEMAEAGRELTQDPQVVQLAQSMGQAQAAEISTMQQLLDDRA